MIMEYKRFCGFHQSICDYADSEWCAFKRYMQVGGLLSPRPPLPVLICSPLPVIHDDPSTFPHITGAKRTRILKRAHSILSLITDRVIWAPVIRDVLEIPQPDVANDYEFARVYANIWEVVGQTLAFHTLAPQADVDMCIDSVNQWNAITCALDCMRETHITDYNTCTRVCEFSKPMVDAYVHVASLPLPLAAK